MACCDDGVSPHPEVADFPAIIILPKIMYFCVFFQFKSNSKTPDGARGGQECVGTKSIL